MFIIFEIANNHNGDFELAKRIINEFSNIKLKSYFEKFEFAFKFQYRDQRNFIHKDCQKNNFPNKYVQRFEATWLSDNEFFELAKLVKEKDFKLIVTPFDELSVDRCIKNEVDYIKIASCSIDDWPLIDKISETNKPIIFSTGGHDLDDIDNLTSYFDHKEIRYSIMHCIPEYPAVDHEHFNMNFISELKKRYPKAQMIGYSGHETARNTCVGIIAASLGANIFERHIGLENLNRYSLGLNDAEEWLKQITDTIEYLGHERKLHQEEKDAVRELQRGVFAKNKIEQGEVLTRENIYFAFPAFEGQLTANVFGKYRTQIKTNKEYNEDDAIYESPIIENRTNQIRKYLHRAKGMLNKVGICLNENCTIQLSHVYGFENFEEYGMIMFTIVNREYCKKIILQFPGQTHPEHLHKLKEETFHVLWGQMQLNDENTSKLLSFGDMIIIDRYRKHSFGTDTGVIFEEISTTSIDGDSHYTDNEIYKLDPLERKTRAERL